MVYVERDAQGKVKGVYGPKQPGYAEEELADDHPDILAFRTALTAPRTNGRTVAQKLASIGIDIADLKAELAK